MGKLLLTSIEERSDLKAVIFNTYSHLDKPLLCITTSESKGCREAREIQARHSPSRDISNYSLSGPADWDHAQMRLHMPEKIQLCRMAAYTATVSFWGCRLSQQKMSSRRWKRSLMPLASAVNQGKAMHMLLNRVNTQKENIVPQALEMEKTPVVRKEWQQ